MAGPTDALADKGDAAMALGRVLRVAGQEAEAREAFGSAAGWYEAKGHTVGFALAEAESGTQTWRGSSEPAPSSESAAASGERAPERFWREFKRRFDAHDVDGLLELFDDDWVSVDHRKLGWEETRGRESQAAGLRSAFAASADVRVERMEVLACDERVIAQIARLAGYDGPTEVGRLRSPSGWSRLSRTVGAEATTSTRPMTGRRCCLGSPSSAERQARLATGPPSATRWNVSGSGPARDLDGMMELYAEDWVLRDHRTVSTQADINGRAELRAQLEALLEMSLEIRLDVDEVIACDERVMAHLVAWRGTARDGGGVFEAPVGFVSVKESGREVSVDQYDPDDRQAMIARYVELGGGLAALGDRSPERWFARLARVQADQDQALLPSLYAEDYVLVDHRNVGWDPTDSRAAAVERIEAIWAGSTDMHLEVHEVLACDERAIALHLPGKAAPKRTPAVGDGSHFRCASWSSSMTTRR